MHPYLIPGLEGSPKVFRCLLAHLRENALDEPTHPGRFTPREVIAHLAEWESILREERLRAPAERNGIPVEAYDEGELAVRGNYAATDVHEQLAIFERERDKTVKLVQSLTPGQMANAMLHPERGWMTVADVANMMMGHDIYHLRQLADVIS